MSSFDINILEFNKYICWYIYFDDFTMREGLIMHNLQRYRSWIREEYE